MIGTMVLLSKSFVPFIGLVICELRLIYGYYNGCVFAEPE